MILIADSGSSKTLWVVRHKGMDIFMKVTPGLNPNFVPEYAIEKIMTSFVSESKLKGKITEVYFYGSGCGRKKGKDEIEGILKSSLPKARIHVESDLTGAAHGLSAGKPSVSCILGTGSNACFYNGKQIMQSIPSYGYIFGDYGSGAHLGKLLLQDYFDGALPKNISKKLGAQKNFSADNCIENIYRKPSPNRFLAGFSPFIEQNKKNTYVKNLLEKSFDLFFKKQVGQIKSAQKFPLHFTGSIAFVFEKELRETAQKAGFTIGRILKTPMNGLVHYHNS